VIGWIARVWSLVNIVLVLLFIFVGQDNPASPTEWIGFLFFPGGVCIGMIVAWWEEGIGGGITVGSLSGYYIYHFATASAFPTGFAWPVFAAPGFLFLLDWYRSRKVPTQKNELIGRSFIDPC
jgi:hypothetical protein